MKENVLDFFRSRSIVTMTEVTEALGQGARNSTLSLVEEGLVRQVGDIKEQLYTMVRSRHTQEVVPPSRINKMAGKWEPAPDHFREGSTKAFTCGSVIAGRVVPYSSSVQ